LDQYNRSDNMRYLLCEKCGGYYELREGESPDDFESCQCGGNLTYYKTESKLKKKGIKKNKLLFIVPFIIVVILAVSLLPNTTTESSQNSIIGSDASGYVTKEVYSYNSTPKAKIAVITGMHPRELISTDQVPQIAKQFAIQNKVEIINYHITVTDQPQNFEIGRDNGQALTAKYVIPDIKKSDCKLVIIAHDHQKGYGNGSYIATPTRDDKSLALGEAVHKITPLLNFYPGLPNTQPKSSSITEVDQPLAKAGFPVFVYEIPEWCNETFANQTTYQLFDGSFKALN
jgi:hypothetical protein